MYKSQQNTFLFYQIDIQQVWASIKDQGASEEDLKLYKKVYSVIDSHGEIGVRCYDLKVSSNQHQDGYCT
jgi:hypothetical protein